MEGKWERRAVPVILWGVIPIMVFGIGFFVIGPLLSGGAAQAKPVESTEPEFEQPTIQPGVRKWTPVSPPQVSIRVEPKDEPLDEQPIDEQTEPPIDETDDSSSGAEGGGEEQSAPPVKKNEETGGAFKGVTTAGGW